MLQNQYIILLKIKFIFYVWKGYEMKKVERGVGWKWWNIYRKIGKLLMLPIAVMPAAALLLGIGYRLDPAGWGANSSAAAFLIKSGASILDNIPILLQ